MKAPITCRLLPQGPDCTQDEHPGDMWEMTDRNEKYYVVVLPNGRHFVTTQEASNGGGRWKVTGEAPRLTVTPSIWSCKDSPMSWHGYLTDGVLKEC